MLTPVYDPLFWPSKDGPAAVVSMRRAKELFPVTPSSLCVFISSSVGVLLQFLYLCRSYTLSTSVSIPTSTKWRSLNRGSRSLATRLKTRRQWGNFLQDFSVTTAPSFLGRPMLLVFVRDARWKSRHIGSSKVVCAWKIRWSTTTQRALSKHCMRIT